MQYLLPALFAVFFSWFVTLTTCHASAEDRHQEPDFSGLPTQYGEIIFQYQGTGANHLYIIGISHRDPQDGSPAETTLKAQADIYRIGEWLSNRRDLQLLLPEGYFADTASFPPASCRVLPRSSGLPAKAINLFLDNDLLTRQLADASHFVNAEMLLMENCHLPATQIEDRPIYDAVRSSLLSLGKPENAPGPAVSDRLAEMIYLQQTRTATLLQKIPSVIDRQMQSGTIRNRSALFTIGLNHLQDIIRYLQNNKISIDFPGGKGQQGIHHQAGLNLLKDGYGVSIIIPRTLADDRQLLQLTKLDQIFSVPTQQSAIPWLN